MTRRTDDPVYRRKRATLRGQHLPCWLCGRAIDYQRKAPDPLAFSADHVDPVGRGGDNRGELRAAHLGCNKKRGTKTREATDILRTSRDW